MQSNIFTSWLFRRKISVTTKWNFVLLIAFALVGLLGTASTTHAQSSNPSDVLAPFELDKVFTYLFLMLGPIKIIGPFAQMTRETDFQFQRQLAFRAFTLSCAAIITASFGQLLLKKWQVSPASLLLTSGIILFLVALNTVLEQYTPSAKSNTSAQAPSLALAFAPLTFPIIITPYGTAALVIILAISSDVTYTLSVLGIALGVMVLNLFGMIFAQKILKFAQGPLMILGAVLAVLQVALGVQIMLLGLKTAGIIGTS